MLTVLIATVAAALAAPLFVRLPGRGSRSAAPWILGAVPLLGTAWLAYTFFIRGGADLAASWDWAPGLGTALAFRADGLAILFTLLVGGIGGLVTIYAGGYLAGHPRLGSFYLLLLLFIASMLGLVLADNLVLLFVCWELTSITSFFLIGFDREKEYARKAAQKALLTTGAGGLALLGGLVLLATMAQRAGLDPSSSLTLSRLPEVGEALRADPLYPAAVGLILLGCFTKSAQMPFHFWLPAAMAGPAPVSALLHSATMVKAGIFLLARLHEPLGGTAFWTGSLTIAGAITMVGGALLALGRRDLKALLAYTTVSALGTLVLLIGLGSDRAIAAMVIFLTVHALYKATLFMVIGNVDHEAGTRDLVHLGGLSRAMPITMAAAVLAALSQAGAPPALGYLGKKLALQAKLDFGTLSEWLVVAAIVTNIAMVAVALVIALRPFWGRTVVPVRRVHEAPVTMLAGPVLLAALGLIIGLVPAVFGRSLGAAAASAVAGTPITIQLKIWSGLSVEALTLLGVSLFGFGAGFLVYRRLHLLWHRPSLPAVLIPLSPTILYERGLAGLFAVAAWQTRQLQRGVLRFYVAVVVLAVVALVLPWLARAAPPAAWAADLAEVALHEFLLVLVILAGTVGAVFTRRPIVAVMVAGAAGVGLALVFASYGGVDLAITQILVETLLVVLFATILRRLPPRMTGTGRIARIRDVGIAALGGTLAVLLVLVGASGDSGRHVAASMLERSVPEAFGRNVVNVILVDFRALDTLGEITVVAAAAVAIGCLLRGRRRRPTPGGAS